MGEKKELNKELNINKNLNSEIINFVEFTFENGRKITLNGSEIITVKSSEKGCYITYKLKDGYSESFTTNNYQSVVDQLKLDSDKK